MQVSSEDLVYVMFAHDNEHANTVASIKRFARYLKTRCERRRREAKRITSRRKTMVPVKRSASLMDPTTLPLLTPRSKSDENLGVSSGQSGNLLLACRSEGNLQLMASDSDGSVGEHKSDGDTGSHTEHQHEHIDGEAVLSKSLSSPG